ncbi:MAG TPA: hypothetical protein VGZ29_05780 [Terriglobia bacterium]|nr:hypothetical protein [Terriglobia bacterium]
MGGLTTLGLLFSIDADPSTAREKLPQLQNQVKTFAAGAAADFQKFGESGIFVFEDIQHKLIETTRTMAVLRAEILATTDAERKLELQSQLSGVSQQYTALRTEMRGMRYEMTEATEKANLLAEQFGTHIPYEMSRLIARVPGVQAALGSLFQAGIVLAFSRAIAESITDFDGLKDKIYSMARPFSELEVMIGAAAANSKGWAEGLLEALGPVGSILDFLAHKYKTTLDAADQVRQQDKAAAKEAAREAKEREREETALDKRILQGQEQLREAGLKGIALIHARGQAAVDELTREDAATSGLYHARFLELEQLAQEKEKLDESAEAVRLNDEARQKWAESERKREEVARKAEEAENKRLEHLKQETEQADRAAKEIQDLTLKIQGADPAMIQYWDRLLEIQETYGNTALAAQIARLATIDFINTEKEKTAVLEDQVNKEIQAHALKGDSFKQAQAEADKEATRAAKDYLRVLQAEPAALAAVARAYPGLTVAQLAALPGLTQLLAQLKAFHNDLGTGVPKSLRNLQELEQEFPRLSEKARTSFAQMSLGWQQFELTFLSGEQQVLGALYRELAAHQSAQQALKALFKEELKQLAEYLAKKAEMKALEQTAEAIGYLAPPFPNFPAAAGHFAAAAAWMALGGAISIAAGALAGSGGGSSGRTASGGYGIGGSTGTVTPRGPGGAAGGSGGPNIQINIEGVMSADTIDEIAPVIAQSVSQAYNSGMAPLPAMPRPNALAGR